MHDTDPSASCSEPRSAEASSAGEGSTPSVSVSALDRGYGDREVLRAIGFELHRGETVGLVGPNGVGKSTLLKVLGGYLRPGRGHVTVLGIDLIAQPDAGRELCRYLPDEPFLIDFLTPCEVATLAMKVRGLQHPSGAAILYELLQLFDLWRQKDSLIRDLSHGTKQKLGILLTLLGAPPVLLLDEPFTGLDLLTSSFLVHLLSLEAAGGRTILVSSHVLDPVAALCSRLLILSEGSLAYDGPTGAWPRQPEPEGGDTGTTPQRKGDGKLSEFVLSFASDSASPQRDAAAAQQMLQELGGGGRCG